MENQTPVNVWRLVAIHQVKFIHWRSHADLEADVNKWLAANAGKYEIKEIKLDFSQSGARLAMIHFYEHVRKEDAKDIKPVASISKGTTHVAPSKNTPQSHNVKSQVPIKPDLNSINNELDKMKPQEPTKIPDGFVVEPATKTETTPEPIAESLPKVEELDIDNIIEQDTRGDLSEADF